MSEAIGTVYTSEEELLNKSGLVENRVKDKVEYLLCQCCGSLLCG